MSKPAAVPETATPENTAPNFSLDRLFVKNLSLEVPNAPEAFLAQGTPDIDVQLGTQARSLGNDFYECSLSVTVTARLPDESTLFLCEVTQSGLFVLNNIPEADLAPIMGVTCPNILFPFAREAIANTISRSGFPPVNLAPINFEALFEQQQLEQLDAATPAGHA